MSSLPILLLATALLSSSATSDHRIESPRLARLAESHRSGDKAALAAFWREIEGKAPLVEPIAGDTGNVLGG